MRTSAAPPFQVRVRIQQARFLPSTPKTNELGLGEAYSIPPSRPWDRPGGPAIVGTVTSLILSASKSLVIRIASGSCRAPGRLPTSSYPSARADRPQKGLTSRSAPAAISLHARVRRVDRCTIPAGMKKPSGARAAASVLSPSAPPVCCSPWVCRVPSRGVRGLRPVLLSGPCSGKGCAMGNQIISPPEQDVVATISKKRITRKYFSPRKTGPWNP